MDADRTGELEYSEFLFGALDKQNLLSSENLKKAFSIFDSDGNGDITLGAFHFVAIAFDSFVGLLSYSDFSCRATFDCHQRRSRLFWEMP